MTLYLDTSAFLKLYLQESDSARVHQAVEASVVVCTHLIAYAEMRAALAQASRMKRISGSDLTAVLRQFEEDWLMMEIIAVDEPLVRRAGELADRFGLRGFDSVHLAAAERVFELERHRSFTLATFDAALCAAAQNLGLALA